MERALGTSVFVLDGVADTVALGVIDRSIRAAFMPTAP
jgi:hypothetical protein